MPPEPAVHFQSHAEKYTKTAEGCEPNQACKPFPEFGIQFMLWLLNKDGRGTCSNFRAEFILKAIGPRHGVTILGVSGRKEREI